MEIKTNLQFMKQTCSYLFSRHSLGDYWLLVNVWGCNQSCGAGTCVVTMSIYLHLVMATHVTYLHVLWHVSVYGQMLQM